ncbi:MAG: hypothetical protein JW811_01355 [Clostridiales bacterium]|nr:hypothetical protein [Clostridiales bacterium]
MNSFTNTILTLLLGWLRTLLNAARDFVSSDSSTVFFNFFRDNWRVLFLVLCIVGFALDIIVYLVRWRPRPLWRRRRARRVRVLPHPQEEYDLSEFNADTPAIPTGDYAPVPGYSGDDYAAKPTAQYQMQSRQGGQPPSTPPVTLPYTTPRFAPEASAWQEEIPELYTDEPAQPAASVGDRPQRFAFGMAPSFGSAQSEPAYNYQRDSAPSFTPPQYSQEYPPTEPNTLPPEQMTGETAAMQPQAFEQPGPYFRPFSDRGEATFAPPKARGLGAVAKKARTLLNADEADGSLSYKDLQPTVDVSKAFHAPVYPEKKPEEDA